MNTLEYVLSLGLIEIDQLTEDGENPELDYASHAAYLSLFRNYAAGAICTSVSTKKEMTVTEIGEITDNAIEYYGRTFPQLYAVVSSLRSGVNFLTFDGSQLSLGGTFEYD